MLIHQSYLQERRFTNMPASHINKKVIIVIVLLAIALLAVFFTFFRFGTCEYCTQTAWLQRYVKLGHMGNSGNKGEVVYLCGDCIHYAKFVGYKHMCH